MKAGQHVQNAEPTAAHAVEAPHSIRQRPGGVFCPAVDTTEIFDVAFLLLHVAVSILLFDLNCVDTPLYIEVSVAGEALLELLRRAFNQRSFLTRRPTQTRRVAVGQRARLEIDHMLHGVSVTVFE